MGNYKHSVTLAREKCKGCTNCLKRCPTEAIRIRNGHAEINAETCVDCGECIRICPYKAKQAVSDPLSLMDDFTYKIALPAPSLYGQFDHMNNIDVCLQALLDRGFDDVFEVARAAEIVSGYSKRYLQRDDAVKPVISSACPVIQRLISIRFPDLIDNVMPMLPPVDIAAKLARTEAKHKHPELDDDEIGIFFISPCPAKVSYLQNEAEQGRKLVDGVFSMSEIYLSIVTNIKRVKPEAGIARTGQVGIRWAGTEGEAKALSKHRFLAADGIENVINVLEGMDNNTLSDLDCIELDACNGGSVGGVMTMENPYIAKARLLYLEKGLPLSMNWNFEEEEELRRIPDMFFSEKELTYTPPAALDPDLRKAFEKRRKIEELCERLPALDCGSCGAPTCRAFAEDVVRGLASEEDCIVNLRGKIDELRREEGQ